MIRVFKPALFASASLVLVAQMAHAADLPDEIAAPAPAKIIGDSNFDWSGFYVGGNAGINFLGDFDNDFGADLDKGVGFIGGGVVGFNHQIDKFVVGVEGDLNYVGGDATDGTATGELDFLGTITTRLGYTPIDRVLTYVEGGYAFGRSDLSLGAVSDNSFHNGFVLGAGAEYAVTDKILTGLEYNYVDLQDRSFDLGAGDTDADFSGHNVKFNLKYKF